MQNNKRILHLMFDGRFIDAPLRIFEKAYPGQNRYVVLSSGTKAELKFVKEIDKIEILAWNIKRVLNEISKHEVVVLHWLDNFKKELILKAPEDIKFVWLCWGGDLYGNHPAFDNHLFEPETKRLIAENISNFSKISFFRKRFHQFLNLFKKTKKLLLNLEKISSVKALCFNSSKYASQECFDAVLQRLDYIACIDKEEADYILKFVDTKAQFIDFNAFGTLNDFIALKLQDKLINGNNVLIGNSATTENNHLDVFGNLKKMQPGQGKIICPLSYGEEWYRKTIKLKGTELFGENFQPLTEYLSLEDYNEILLSCKIMIMNHIRAQAMGNILTGLFLGMKVYLNEKNLLYSFFKNRACIIFSIQKDFISENKECLESLAEEGKIKNREIIKSIWNEEIVVDRVKNLIIKVKKEL